MDRPTKPIAAISGADGAVIQQLLRAFVQRQPPSLKVAGVIEESIAGARRSSVIRQISDDLAFPVFQNLGAGATGCALDPGGISVASEAILREVEAGCDLVVVSKFGKLEADSGAGFVPVFAAAMEAGTPAITSVSPKYADAWARFAGPYFTLLPAEPAAIDAWWAGASRQG